MAVDPQGKDSTLPSLDSLIAAGGNSSAARSLRVKSQLRDRLGRWVEMGRDSKLHFLDKLGEIASAVGKFLGNSDREGFGRFYVENDPVLGTGVYEFPSESIEQIAATLDENYLVSKNIDVNGNKIKGIVPSDGIPKFDELVKTDLTPQDQDVVDNPLTAEEKDVQVKARLDAPAHESKNVIAKIDATDLEDMKKNNVDWEKYGIKSPVAEIPKDEHYDRRRKEFQDTITAANPELAASLFGDNPDAELKKNVDAELAKIDEVSNLSTKYGAYESVAQSLLEGTFTPSSDDKIAWYPVVGKENHTIGILDGETFYAQPQGSMLIVTGNGANNRVETLEQFDELAPEIVAANKERLIDDAKRNLAVYDTDGKIAEAIDAGATSAEIEPLLKDSPQYLQDQLFVEDSQNKNFLSPDERAASNRITAARTALINVDKVNKKKPAEKARLEPEQSGLDGVFKKLEDAGIADINNPESENVDILQARDTAMYMSDLIEEATSNGEPGKADLYDRLANSLLEHFRNKEEGKAAKAPKVVGKADTIQKITARKSGATLNPMTLSQPRKGIAVALEDTNEEIVDTIFFDEKLGNLAIAKYIDNNRDKFRDGFKLGTWHDEENNEVTLDVIELFPEANQAEAEAAGQNRNQQGIFKLSNKDYISTGGTGDRGRARRERELARQSGNGSPTGRELGQPDASRESRVSRQPEGISNIPDEWSADRLKVNGIIPASVYSERMDRGKELGQILPSSDKLIGVPVTGDVNVDAMNFLRASRQLILDGSKDSPKKQRKFKKALSEIELLLAKGYTPIALEHMSALGMDFSNFYHSDGRDKVFGIDSATDASEAAMDLYWYGRTAAKSLGTNVNPDTGAPRIESAENFAVDVDDLGDAMLKSPTLSKDKGNVVNVSQVISDLTNSTSTAQTVDTLQQVANSLINGYLKNQDLKFEVGDIAQLVDSIANVVKKNKAKKTAPSALESEQRLDSTPSGGDEDLGDGGDKTTHLQKFKQLVDEIIADQDITQFFGADKVEYFYNMAENAETPEEYTNALKTLSSNIWAQMSRDEEWHEVEINENPLFPFVNRLDALVRTAPMDFEKLEKNQPDMSATVSGDRLADIELNTRTLDRSKLSDSQKAILRSLVSNRNNALKNLKSAAQTGNTSAYEFNYNIAFATTRTIKKLVANSEAQGADYKFGSGEEDRISNFVIFEDSITTTPVSYNNQAENGEDKVTRMEGLYVSKSGKTYLMKWDGQTSYAYTIKKDGSIGQKAGYVNCSWSGEASRGADFKNSVTPAMLKTYDRYQRDGIGGANITFARLAAEKSGRHYAHSGTLTGMGANNSKGIDPADPDRHSTHQSEKVLWMMKAPIFRAMSENGWFDSTKTFKLGGYNRSLASFNLAIDPTGYRNDSSKMMGPFYMHDGQMAAAVSSAVNKYRSDPNSVVAGVDYPAFMEDHVKGVDGKKEAYSVRKLIIDMSYKDGKSVDEVLKVLKEQRSQFVEFKDNYEPIINADTSLSEYYRERKLESINNSISFMDEYIPLIENNKEMLDNPENRVERPKPFAKDSFKVVKRSPYGDTSVGETQLKAIGKNAELINEAPDVDYEIPYISNGNYKQLTGKGAPEGWVYDSAALARRFDAETLRGALVNVLTSDKPVTDNFAELDFGRKYGAPAVGYVSPRSVVLALVHQEGMTDFNRWIASTMDGINGGDANVQAMRSKPNPKADLIAEMDKLLAKEGLEPNRATPTVAKSRGLEDSTYDPATRVVVSARRNSQFRGYSYNLNPQFPLLPKNEKFDLDNGQDDVLGGTYNSNSAHAIQKRNDGGSNSPVYIANNFDSKALEDAFVDALNNRRLSIQLKFNDTQYVQSTEITAIRDALQHQGVDTNELVKKRVTSLRKPVDETSLNQIGRTIPEPVSSLVAHATTEINLDTFVELPGEIFGGINAPTVMLDPATGKKYVVKRLDSSKDGWGSRAIDQEIAAQAFYRAMGVRASKPQRGTKAPTLNPAMTPVEDRHEYVVTEFIPAATGGNTYDRALHGFYRDPNNPILEAVRHGLPADILLDHIDGPFNSNNTVIDENGNIVRIDGGGALMWDPLPDQGPKGPEGREMRLRGNHNWRATDEQKALFEAANRDGTFEGEGVNFAFDFFLNPNGWHWMPGYNGRKRILEGLTDDQMKQYTRETVLPLTPDKIEAISEIIRDPNDRSRVAKTLIARRKAILDRYGIEDDSVSDSEPTATPEQFSQFYSIWTSKFDTAAEGDAWLVSQGYAENTSVNDFEATSKSRMDKLLVALQALPSKDQSAADAINKAEEARNAAIQNGVDTTIYGAHPAEAETVLKPTMDLVFGDILVGMADENGKIKEKGRVVFNAVGSDGKRTVAYVDANKKVNFITYDGAKRDTGVVLTYSYPQGTRPMQSDIAEGAANRDLRNDYQNRHVARSTAILQDIKNTYPKHVELESGDLVVASRDFTTAGGDTYKYEVIVHRKPNEEFVTYVRETPINAAGEVIGSTTINKISVSTHSSTHLKNKIIPLLQGDTIGKGIFGRNPRNWFNQGNNRQAEVIHPGTGLPVPRSLAPEQLDAKYIGNTGIKATGDAVKDALIGYVADLVDRKVETGALLLRLSSQNIVSRSQINDIIERIQANRAFPGVNQIPYLSRDGENIVRVGDRVRHYAADGTVKEGIVRKRRPLSVNQKPGGTYSYSDVLVVKFDGRAQGTPIVAKHLEILRRADGSPASFRGEEPEVVEEPPFLPIPQNLTDAGVTFEDLDDRVRVYKSPNGRSGRVTKLPRVYGSQDTMYSAQGWEADASQSSDTPTIGTTTNDRNLGQTIVLNWLKPDESDSGATVVQAARPTEEEDLGGFTPDIVEQPVVSKFMETAQNSMIEETVVPEDGSFNISFGTIDGVKDGTLPIYHVSKSKVLKHRKISYWLNRDDLGDKDKAKYIKVPRNASDADIRKIILENAEDRLKFASEKQGAHTYSLTLSNGTVVEDELGYEEFNSMATSSVTGSHLKRDGKGNLVFDEKRMDAHRKILEKLLAGIEPPKDRKPKMFFLGGGPASGKGGFTKYNDDGTPGKLAKDYGIPPVREIDDVTGEENAMPKGLTPGAVVIDPDTIKILLPEVREMHARQMMRRVEKSLGLTGIFRTGSNDGKWAENAHEESSMLAKMLQQAAIEQGLDIVYDGTGDGKRSGIEKKLATAKDSEHNYDTVGLYMTTDLPVAIGSAKLRKDRTGRHVPGTTQNDIYFALAKLLNPDNPDGNVAPLFDSWNLIYRQPKEVDKNTGQVVKEGKYINVAHTDENKELKYDDPALWSGFMGLAALNEKDIENVVAKGEEYYRTIKAERRQEEETRLREAGKSKVDMEDLGAADRRVMQIRGALKNISNQTGIPVARLAQDSEIMQLILNNAPVVEILAASKKLR